jgi:hypothetical protein
VQVIKVKGLLQAAQVDAAEALAPQELHTLVGHHNVVLQAHRETFQALPNVKQMPHICCPQQQTAGSSCCSTHSTTTRGSRKWEQPDKLAAIPPKRSKKGQNVQVQRNLI